VAAFLRVLGSAVGVAAAAVRLLVGLTAAAGWPELDGTDVTTLASWVAEERPAPSMMAAAEAPGTATAVDMTRVGRTL
jgi:hypothetical protein